MNVGLYQAAAALTANSQWQDVVAENLASSSVPGYRKMTLATAAVQAGLMPVNNPSSGAPASFVLPQSSASVSFQPAQMDYTGDNRDAGIDGSGFFQIQLANGITAVTRAGEFRVNSKGKLVTKEGYTVLGQNGPIQLDPHDPGGVTISATGDVKQGDAVRGKLSLTDYENPQLLTPTNGVYFLATDPGLVAKPATGSMRDGFVEEANTSALGEMANMMTAMRTFEANQHVVQMQDDRLGKVISELGNPS